MCAAPPARPPALSLRSRGKKSVLPLPLGPREEAAAQEVRHRGLAFRLFPGRLGGTFSLRVPLTIPGPGSRGRGAGKAHKPCKCSEPDPASLPCRCSRKTDKDGVPSSVLRVGTRGAIRRGACAGTSGNFEERSLLFRRARGVVPGRLLTRARGAPCSHQRSLLHPLLSEISAGFAFNHNFLGG